MGSLYIVLSYVNILSQEELISDYLRAKEIQVLSIHRKSVK